MKNFLFLINTIALLFIYVNLFSQEEVEGEDGSSKITTNIGVLDGGSYEKIHIQEKLPVPYQYVREADVMWSKTIWRKIDLREKMNHTLYYPETPLGSRMSLIDLLLWGVENKHIDAFDPPLDATDEFKTTISYKQISEGMFDAKDQVTIVEDVETGERFEEIIKGELKSYEVKEYLLKETWFFDKQRSVMDFRIIGLCPIRYYFREGITEGTEEDLNKKKVCWISYAQARDILVNHEAFNLKNDAERRSFDEIFIKRYFASYIYRESNAYNNREIGEYTVGIETLLEAEHVKETITNFEIDLWEY